MQPVVTFYNNVVLFSDQARAFANGILAHDGDGEGLSEGRIWRGQCGSSEAGCCRCHQAKADQGYQRYSS